MCSKNALVYYPRKSPKFATTYGLCDFSIKDMKNIFHMEALFKQEGPSMRKRKPRKLSKISLSAKTNPTPIVPGRKRNAKTSHGEYKMGGAKGAQPTLEQSSPYVIQLSSVSNQ